MGYQFVFGKRKEREHGIQIPFSFIVAEKTEQFIWSLRAGIDSKIHFYNRGIDSWGNKYLYLCVVKQQAS